MANFYPAFENTIRFEDDAREPGKVTVDAGGRTRFGIAEKFHPGIPEWFFAGDVVRARTLAENIEYGKYWKPLNLHRISDQSVANKIFDMAVNMGFHQAAVLTQRAVNALNMQAAKESGDSADAVSSGGIAPMAALFPLVEDGVIGPKTLEQLNDLASSLVLDELRALSADYYRAIVAANPAQAVNLNGWLKRAAA